MATAFSPRAARSISRRQGLGTIELGVENFTRQFESGEPFEPFNIREDTLSEILDEARNVLGDEAVRTNRPRDPYSVPIEGERDLSPREEESVLELAQRINEASKEHNLPTTSKQLDDLVRQSIAEGEEERALASARATTFGKIAGFGGAMARETTNPIILASMLVGAGPITTAGRFLPQLGRVAATEGIIGGVSEVPVQAIRQSELRRLGIGESAGQIAAHIGLAAAGGAIFGPVFASAGVLARRLAAKSRERQLTPNERAQSRGADIVNRQGNERFPFAIRSQRTVDEFLTRDRNITEALSRGSLKLSKVPETPSSLSRADTDLPIPSLNYREILQRVGDEEGIEGLDQVATEAHNLRGEVNRSAVTEEELQVEMAQEVLSNPRSRRAAEAADELVNRGDPEGAAQIIRATDRALKLRDELKAARQAKAEGKQPERDIAQIVREMDAALSEATTLPPRGEGRGEALQHFVNGKADIEPLVQSMRAADIDPQTATPERMQQFVEDASATRQRDIIAGRVSPSASQTSEAQVQDAFIPEGDAPTAPEMEELSNAFARELEDAPEGFTFVDVDAQGNPRTMTPEQELARTQAEQDVLSEFKRCAGVETEDASG